MRCSAPLLRRPIRLAQTVGPMLGTALVAAGLVGTLGGSAALATPVPVSRVATPAAAKFAWHPLSLLNNWTSANGPSTLTGTPGWAVRDGVVYFRGAITNSTVDASSIITTLPPQARPSHDLYLQVFTNAAAPGTLLIETDGEVQAFAGNFALLTSLAGVSYPTNAIKFHRLALVGGWVSRQARWLTGNPAYAISDGIVYLGGSMHNNGKSTLVAVLPPAARPARDMYFDIYSYQSHSGGLEVELNGDVRAFGSNVNAFSSLAGLAYPVASTKWHNFKLTDGWKVAPASDGCGAPAYTTINGVVYLTGGLTQPKPETGLWTDPMPAATQPKDSLNIEVYTWLGAPGALSLSNLGVAGSYQADTAQRFTSLAGVAYPPGA